MKDGLMELGEESTGWSIQKNPAGQAIQWRFVQVAPGREGWCLCLSKGSESHRIDTGEHPLLVYCLAGSARLGCGSLSDQHAELTPFSLVLLNAGDYLSLDALSDCEVLGLPMPSSQLIAAGLRGGWYCDEAEFHVDSLLVHSRSGSLPALLEDILRLSSGSACARGFCDEYLRLCDSLVINLWPGNLRAFYSHRQLAHPLLRQARQFLLDELQRPFHIEEMAKACRVSSRTLYQLFRRELGVSPGEFVRYLKIESAYSILSRQNGEAASATVTDIAIDYGFTNFGRFSRQYRDHIGELPSETRRRCDAESSANEANQRLRSSSLANPSKVSA